MCGEYKLVQKNRQSHTINTRYCYLLKITVSMKLHVSAHESHHQAYKYSTIKMKNVQLLAGLYDDGSHEPKHVASCSPLFLINNSILYLLCVIDDFFVLV